MKLRPRISLRLFLLLTFLCAAAMGWFTSGYLARYRHEAVVLEKLAALGGEVDRVPRQPQWLWSRFGKDVAEQASVLGLSDTKVSDVEMIDIAQLDGLESLYLDRTAVTDFGMAQIGNLRQLVGLSARQSKIQHAPPLAGMLRLIELNLSFTDVAYVDTTDLISLQSLNLRATRVSDDALSLFTAMPRLKTLDIAGSADRKSAVSDKGVAYLTREKFPKLTRLYLYETEVSLAAVSELKTRMPGLAIYGRDQVASGPAGDAPAAR